MATLFQKPAPGFRIYHLLRTLFYNLLLPATTIMNTVLWAYGIEWHGPLIALLKYLRNRSGTLAVANMIPLVLMAGRNNPFIKILGMPYDSFNMLHRWFGH